MRVAIAWLLPDPRKTHLSSLSRQFVTCFGIFWGEKSVCHCCSAEKCFRKQLPSAYCLKRRKPISCGKVMTTISGHRFSIKPWLRWGNHEGPFNMAVTPITASPISDCSQWLFYFPPVAASSSPGWSLLSQLSCSEDPLSSVIHGWESVLWDRSSAPVIYPSYTIANCCSLKAPSARTKDSAFGLTNTFAHWNWVIIP